MIKLVYDYMFSQLHFGVSILLPIKPPNIIAVSFNSILNGDFSSRLSCLSCHYLVTYSLADGRRCSLCHVIDSLKALEIAESGVVSGTGSLCLLLDGVSVLPLAVHEADLVLTDNGGADVLAHRAEVIVELVLGGVVV